MQIAISIYDKRCFGIMKFPHVHTERERYIYIHFLVSCFVQENVHSVLASEQRVAQLMNSIDAAITEASIVEARLAAYDESLGRIREVMARVGQKNQAIHTANNNARLLLDQLNLVIVSRQKYRLTHFASN